MTHDVVTVVVYCDGKPGSPVGDRTPPKPHPEHPIAAYQLISDGWLSLQYATFNGAEFRATSQADQVAGDGPIPRPTRLMTDGRELFDVGAYAHRQQALEQHREPGDELHSHYLWRCAICGFYIKRNTEPMHKLFHVFAAADARVSLAQLDLAAKRA